MSTGEIIILIVYALGLLATYHFQGKKINSLMTRIKTQEGILRDVKTYMEIFDIKKIKETTDFLIESAEKRTKEEIEKLKHELESKSSKSEKTLDEDFVEVMFLIARSIHIFAFSPSFKKEVDEMKETNAKNLIENILERYEQGLKSRSLSENQKIMIKLIPFLGEQLFHKNKSSTEKIT